MAAADPRLSGVFLKLSRADNLRTDLEAAMRNWVESWSDRGKLGTKPSSKPDFEHFDSKIVPGEHVLRITRRIPPEQWAVVMGELVHQLRSSLDHVVYLCAARATEAAKKKLQFPISATEQEFDAYLRDRGKALKTLDREILNRIERAQPYHYRNQYPIGMSPLEQLAKLNNIDKHRMLNAVALEDGDLIGTILDNISSLPALTSMTEGITSDSVPPSNREDIYVGFTVTPADADITPAFAMLLPIRIVFGELQVDIAGLKDITRAVEDIVQSIEEVLVANGSASA